MHIPSQFRWLILPLLLLWLAPFSIAAGQGDSKDTLPPLAMTIDAHEVTVTGGHPNGRILFVGYERVGGKYKLTFRRNRAYLPADSAGELTLTPRDGISADSTWVGVDIQSGRFGAISPGPSVVRQTWLPDDAPKNDNNGQLKKFVAGLPMAYVVVVRPGEGAWESSAGDGGRHDRDNSVNGKTEMSLDDFQSLSDVPSELHQLRKGDLLLVFSPDAAAFSVLRLKK